MRPVLPFVFVLAMACVGDTDKTDETDVTDNGEVTDGMTDGMTDEGMTDGDTGDGGVDRDSDRDGLLDSEEVTLNTDPNNPDSDDDDLSDGLEVDVYRTDPNNPDTDGDKLFDGDEIDEGTDPLNPDTDGDGLEDGAEIVAGSNPLLKDTDLDGLEDGQEPKFNTDPVEWDTDGDGLPDGMEALNTMTDPNLVDTDEDTLSDFDEWFVYGTDPLLQDSEGDGLRDDLEVLYGSDPYLEDTDGDTLSDPDEVFTWNTDPTLLDTDTGGAPDGREVLTDGTDPNDPTDDLCLYVYDVDLNDDKYVAKGPNFVPSWITVSTAMHYDDVQGNQDFWVDANADGKIDTDETVSAQLNINLHGPEFDYICSVMFDANNATYVDSPTWTTPDTSSIYGGFTYDTTGAGTTDCATLDATLYGDTDIRQVLGDLDWGTGFGELGDLEPALRATVEAQGEDWKSDWEDQVYGGWVTWDETDASFLSYGFIYESSCDTATVDANGNLLTIDAVTAAPLTPDSLQVSEPFLAIPFEEVTGLTCDEAELDISSDTWTAGTTTMTAALAQFRVIGGINPIGEFGDFYADPDGKGLEAQSAQIEVAFADSGFNELCTIVYDASGATPVDVNDVSIVDLNGNPQGVAYSAWSIDLEDGEGDCGSLDLKLGWTNADPEVVLEGIDLVVAFGPLDTILDINGPAFFPLDWKQREPYTFSTYLSTGGGGAKDPATGFGWTEHLNVDGCMEVNDVVDPLDKSLVAGGAAGVPQTVQMPVWFNINAFL